MSNSQKDLQWLDDYEQSIPGLFVFDQEIQPSTTLSVKTVEPVVEYAPKVVSLMIDVDKERITREKLRYYINRCMTLEQANEGIHQFYKQLPKDEEALHNKIQDLEAEIKRLKQKYEHFGQKCNKGHINYLPVSLWDCPMCTEELRKRIKGLEELIQKIFHAFASDCAWRGLKQGDSVCNKVKEKCMPVNCYYFGELARTVLGVES